MLRWIINSVHDMPVRVGGFFAAVTAVIVVRTYLEYLLEPSHSIVILPSFYSALTDYIHVYLSWLTLFGFIGYLLYRISGESILKSYKAVLAFFPIIWTVPLIDYSVGNHTVIRYSDTFETFWHVYLYLFVPSEQFSTITVGVRVEIMFVMCVTLLYLYTLTHSLIKSVAGVLAVYSLIFLYGYLPALYGFMFSVPFGDLVSESVLPVQDVTHMYAYMYLPLVLLASYFVYRSLSEAVRATLLSSLRLERLTIYIGAFLLAFVEACKGSFIDLGGVNLYDLLKVMAALLSVTLLFVSAVMRNDLVDFRGDSLSNPGRPLVQQRIEHKDFSSLSYLFMVLGLLCAIIVNEQFVFLQMALVALAFLYSEPPYRLKRFVGVSHGVLALIFGTVMLSAFVVVDANMAFEKMDARLVYGAMALFWVSSHLKDVKDEAGDRSEGVVTIATLLGAVRAKNIARMFSIVAFAGIGIVWRIDVGLLVFLTLALSLGLMLVNKSELVILVVQLFSFALAIVYLWSA